MDPENFDEYMLTKQSMLQKINLQKDLPTTFTKSNQEPSQKADDLDSNLHYNSPGLQSSQAKIYSSIFDGFKFHQDIKQKNYSAIEQTIARLRECGQTDLFYKQELISEPSRPEQVEFVKKPYIFTAIQTNSVEIIDLVMSAIPFNKHDIGPVCISPKRGNLVISNQIGAAAWAGSYQFIMHSMADHVSQINQNQHFKAIEGEKKLGISSCLCKEFSNFTPLMLAMVAEHQDIRVIEILLKSNANYYQKDDFKNSVLHLAAIYQRNIVIKFIIENLKLNIHEKNEENLTALDICKNLNNKMGIELLEKYVDPHKDSKGNPIIDKEGGTIVQPNAGFVIVANCTKTESKVYLNMTSHELVLDASEQQMNALMDNSNKIDKALTIPLSLGNIREELVYNKRSLIFDFIWNPRVLVKARENKIFFKTLADLGCSYINQRHDVDLRFNSYKIHPKISYAGDTVMFQRIKIRQQDKQPLNYLKSDPLQFLQKATQLRLSTIDKQNEEQPKEEKKPRTDYEEFSDKLSSMEDVSLAKKYELCKEYVSKQKVKQSSVEKGDPQFDYLHQVVANSKVLGLTNPQQAVAITKLVREIIQIEKDAFEVEQQKHIQVQAQFEKEIIKAKEAMVTVRQKSMEIINDKQKRIDQKDLEIKFTEQQNKISTEVNRKLMAKEKIYTEVIEKNKLKASEGQNDLKKLVTQYKENEHKCSIKMDVVIKECDIAKKQNIKLSKELEVLVDKYDKQDKQQTAKYKAENDQLMAENRKLKSELNQQKVKFQSIAKETFDNCKLNFMKQFDMCQSNFNDQVEYLHSEDENLCVICQQDFLANSKRTKLTCGHNQYHEKCIKDWLKKSSTCPLCVEPVKIAAKKKK